MVTVNNQQVTIDKKLDAVHPTFYVIHQKDLDYEIPIPRRTIGLFVRW